jgi:hypothetical protein
MVINGLLLLNTSKEGIYYFIFRTDNTIKNHFYSTIRRSLRRMSKLIGSKNSTKQMKYIKPSTLSKIFAINIQPTSKE